MRHLAGGVSGITAGRGDDISGMTVTSVASLAIEPATLTVAINRKASSLPLLLRYGAFGVNILTGGQAGIAERFTGKDGHKGAARFAGSSWTTGAFGVPLLDDALVGIACELEKPSSGAWPCRSSGGLGGRLITRLLARRIPCD